MDKDTRGQTSTIVGSTAQHVVSLTSGEQHGGESGQEIAPQEELVAQSTVPPMDEEVNRRLGGGGRGHQEGTHYGSKIEGREFSSFKEVTTAGLATMDQRLGELKNFVAEAAYRKELEDHIAGSVTKTEVEELVAGSATMPELEILWAEVELNHRRVEWSLSNRFVEGCEFMLHFLVNKGKLPADDLKDPVL